MKLLKFLSENKRIADDSTSWELDDVHYKNLLSKADYGVVVTGLRHSLEHSTVILSGDGSILRSCREIRDNGLLSSLSIDKNNFVYAIRRTQNGLCEILPKEY